jgi:hypothetical protein
MLVECAHCGAPLAVKRKARRTKCRYCGAVDERARLRAIAEETPKDFEPPKVWTPPKGAAADSTKPLPYKGDSPMFAWGFAVVIVAAVVGIPLLVESRMWHTRPETLEHASPIGARKDVAKRLGGKALETEVDVELNSERYEKVSIRYANATDEVPTSMAIEVRHGQKADPAARDLVSSRLNGGLDDHDGWDWGGVRLSTGSGGLYGKVEGTADPALRKRRMLAIWSILMGAAFDPALAPAPDEMREVLGGGYPVSGLAKILPTTPIDHAKATVLETFPGALVDGKTQMRVTIPLDHPYFRSVEMEWFVMAGGTLSDAYFQAKSGFEAGKAAFARCLAQTLGAPRESIRNPIEGTKDYTFVPGNAYMELTSGLSMHAYGLHNVPVTVDAEVWQKVVRAIDACRG